MKTKRTAHNKLSIPPKEELVEHYIDKKLPMTEIGKIYSVSNVTVRKWLDHHEIPKRSHADNQKIVMNRTDNLTGNAHIPKESLKILNCPVLLSKEFETTKFNRYQMARHLGVSASCIDKRLARHDMQEKHIFTNQSTDEQDIVDFIEKNKLGISIIRNSRKICPPKEIDIYIPELNLAIEYCGIFYHTSNGGGKSKRYHQQKMLECNSKGIRLLTIFSNEWYENNGICKSRIAAALGVLPVKIHARKCTLFKPSQKEEKEFFESNHIQGYTPSNTAFALKYENRLVSMMSFRTPRYSTKYQWELLRFSNEINSTVVGGASKLFNTFNVLRSPESVVSYCDLRWGTGNLYKQLGFNCITKHTEPNYFYTPKNCQTLESRLKYQKHKLSNLLDSFDKSLTEKQNMHANGYDWIYDCGNSVWVWESIRS